MMLRLRPTVRHLIAAGFVAASAFTLSTPVLSGVIGSSVLEILNFQVRNSVTGTQLTLTGPGTAGDITILDGTNTADVSTQLNAVALANASPGVSVTVGPAFGAIDLAQICVGTNCPPFLENSFSGFGQVTPPINTYSLADMVLTGSALDSTALGGPSGGANARTRSDVSIAGGTNDGSSTSNTGADVAVQLTAAADTSIEFSFDYILQMLAFMDTSDGSSGNTQAGASWSLSFFQLSNPLNKLSFSPNEINQTINLSVDADVPINESGSLVTDSFLMLAGQTYQLGVSHSTRADATFIQVPEPGLVALFGFASLFLGFANKYRRRNG